MKKPKFKMYKLEGCSIGFGYHSRAFHVVFFFWSLSIEFSK